MIKLLGLLFFCITFLLLIGDSFNNPSSSLKYFFIDSRFLYNLFVILQILFCFLNKKLLPERFIKFNNWFIFPSTAVLFIILALVNGLTYQFFVFNTFALNLENFKYLFFISGLVLLANIKATWLSTFAQKSLYFGGILFLIVFNLISIFYPDTFKMLIKEDGFLENIQLFFYLLGMVVAIVTAICFYRTSHKVYMFFFIALALGLFFISGEEISWGQRILHIQTPQELSDINLQHEITVHNIGFFQSKIDYIYMLIGLWGAFSGIFAKRFLPQLFKKYYLIFPSPLLFFYFFAVTRYYFLNKFVVFSYQLFSFEKIGIGDRQEVSETLLAFGFACFAIFSYKAAKKF